MYTVAGRSLVVKTLLIAAVQALTGCASDRNAALPADTVLRNGKIVTVDATSSVAQAMAVRDGRFVAVGSDGDVSRFIGAGTKVIDLGGRTVVPGLSDAHMHNEGGGPNLDLSAARSIAELLARVGTAARGAKPGDIVVSNSDWHEAQLAEQRLPLAGELETAAAGVPVVLATPPRTSSSSRRRLPSQPRTC